MSDATDITISDRSPGRQHPLTEDDLRAICRAAFGAGATLERADRIGRGSINTSYVLHVAGEAPSILRVAPSEAVAAAGPSWLTSTLLRREQAVIAALASLDDLLPRTIATDFSGKLVPHDWVIQTVVPGQPWADVAELTPDQQVALWQQLGALANRMHCIHGGGFGPPPPSRAFSRWSDLLANDVDGFLADARRFDIQAESLTRLRAVVERLRPVLDAKTRPRLIHSDLNPAHVFVAPDGAGQYRISGLIDLEFGRFADPLSESTFVLFDLDPQPDAFRDAFLAGYGPLPDVPGRDIRALVYQAVALGWFATDLAHQGKRSIMQEVLGELERVVTACEAVRVNKPGSGGPASNR